MATATTTTDDTWTMGGLADHDAGYTVRGLPTVDDSDGAVGGLPGWCSERVDGVPRPSLAMVAWVRFEARATWLLSALGLLRPWYELARLVLRACPPLARLVAPLRPVVLLPSKTGGGLALPVSGGREVGRPMAFECEFLGAAECDEHRGQRLAPPPVEHVVRRRRSRHVDAMVSGWRMVRGRA